jgi:hypothetical protein
MSYNDVALAVQVSQCRLMDSKEVQYGRKEAGTCPICISASYIHRCEVRSLVPVMA